MEKKFNYTPQQQAAINHRGGSLLVSAAAGSGKTKVLVDRLLSQVEEGANINEFLVITYTRAAASELREKIYDEIQERLSQAPDNRRLRRQALLCRGAQIGTIHSFCTEILRENAHNVNLTSDFRVADESECDMLKADVLEDVLDKAYETYEQSESKVSDGFFVDFEAFKVLVDSISPGRDDRRLAEIILNIHAKLQSNPNPRTWAALQIEMLNLSEIKEISETVWGGYLMKRARETAAFWLGEMKKIGAEMKAYPDFEKAYGASIEATIVSIEAFLSALYRGWNEAKKMSEIEFPSAKRVTGYDDLKDIRLKCKAAMKKLSDIFQCSSEEHMEDMLAVAASMGTLTDLVLEFDRLYCAEKRRRRVVDFSDLEHLTLALLIDEDGQHTGFAKAISKRFREILIDEFQDVNAVQELIFNAISQDGSNVFMVGDVKQSIYRFRLADPSIFLEKYKRFADLTADSAQPEGNDARAERAKAQSDTKQPEHKGSKILLSQNFRSCTEILEAVNFVFSRVMSQKFGEMDYTEREALVPGRVDEHDPTQDFPVEFNIIDMSTLEQDEDEESPAKTQIEARYIAERIAELTDGKHLIPNKNGEMRPIEYSDIVILLRSIAGKAWQYAAALSEQGIPIALPGGEGFFETVEISAALSLLSVIDNPMQDIPLAAALSGPIYRFSADELAEIRACSPGSDFYAALIDAAANSIELSTKCAAFLEEIDAMHLIMPDLPADRFIWHVYNKTGLLEIVGKMRGGEKRQNNLILLAESARAFEQSGYKGIFGFLVYIRGLQARGAELRHDGGGSVSADVAQDAVQIMSIHKSKGLEFPVVFLADTSKLLNNSDAQKSLVVHTEFGFGPMRTDRQRRIEYTTIARMAVQSKLTSEMMAEELRVLYVAMTRAREKLIITAAVKDAEKELKKYNALAPSERELSATLTEGVYKDAIAPQLLEDIKSMAGWILAAYSSSPMGAETMALSVIEADMKYEQLEAFDYPTAAQQSPSKIPICGEVARSDGMVKNTVIETFSYPHPRAPELPSKLTVTGLKGLNSDPEAQVLYFASDSELQEEKPASGKKRNIAFKRPSFITERATLTAAERGIALHLALQYIDFSNCENLIGVKAQINELAQNGVLTQEQAEAIEIQKLMKFFESDIGKRILSADNLRREFKFSLLYPAEHFYPDGGDDEIMLQGVIDCFFEENGELTVVDFKTDYVTSDTIEEKAMYYAPQLNAYSDALERITQKSVKERIIYFFHTNHAYDL